MLNFHVLSQRVFIAISRSTKIYLKSGFVGAGNHKSILDFLYYSYLFNPVFVRIIVYKKEDT